MKFGSLLISCGVVQAVLAAFPALAQTAASAVPYNIGNAVQESEQARRAAPRPVSPGRPVLPQLVEPQLQMKSNEKLHVKSFVLDGPMLVDAAEVRASLAPYEGRKLNLAEIYEAADKVTTIYRDKGYLFAKVYVPAQDARPGNLRLKIVPGTLGAVTIQNASLINDAYLKRVIDHALAANPGCSDLYRFFSFGDPAPGSTLPGLLAGCPAASAQYIHKEGLERAMLLVSDLAGANMPKVAVGAGQRPETSDLAFSVPEGQRVNGFLLGDNFGSPWTGRDRISAGLDVNSPLGYGDKFSGFGIVSTQTHLLNGRIAYSFPIGYDGLHAEIAGFRTTYVLGGSFADLHASGTANGGSATLTYPVVRGRDSSIYLSGNFTHKGLDDKAFYVSFANRTIDLGTAAISRETYGTLPFTPFPFQTNTALSITAGYVNYADPTQKAENVAGPDTAGNYERLNLTFTGLVAFDENWSASLNLRAQKSLSGNLDTSEQLQLTGAYGIRSFDEGFAGDSGYIVTPELRYALPTLYGYKHSLGLFTDVGAVWLENGSYTVTQKTYTQLNDVGAGYYGSYEYSPGRNLILKAMVAHTYGAQNGTNLYDRHTKGLVQIGFTF